MSVVVAQDMSLKPSHYLVVSDTNRRYSKKNTALAGIIAQIRGVTSVAVVDQSYQIPKGVSTIACAYVPHFLPDSVTSLIVTASGRYPTAKNIINLKMIGKFDSFPQEYTHAVHIACPTCRLRSIPDLPNVVSLDLISNPISHLSEMPNLQCLDIRKTGVRFLPPTMVNLQHLRAEEMYFDVRTLLRDFPEIHTFNGEEIDITEETEEYSEDEDMDCEDNSLVSTSRFPSNHRVEVSYESNQIVIRVHRR